MSRISHLVLVPLSVWLLLSAGFAEEKKAQIIKGWGTVVDPDGDCKVTADQDKVTITVPKTWHDLTRSFRGNTKLNAPRILQDVQGDFRLQVLVHPSPLPDRNTSSSGRFSFVGAGLLIWQDDKNFIRMDRASVGASPFIHVERIEKGKNVFARSMPWTATDTYLRVERRGNKLTFAASKEGGDSQWMEVEILEAELPPKLKVGVLAINTTTKIFSPQLEGLKLSSK